MTATKFNENIRVHIVCSGLPYGHGEANDVFYEFFRRSWLSLHPDLASLPVIDTGRNNLPTIHVKDLARFVKYLSSSQAAQVRKPYFIAVDLCKSSTQREIIQSISKGLGSGNTQQVALSDVIDEEWSEMLSLDLRLAVSPEFLSIGSEWHCKDGITDGTMKLLNDEFNLFRGLFPLKVFIGGPPGSGKTHFTKLLAASYGIPHLTIEDMVEHAKRLKDEVGQEIRAKIDELKQEEIEKYEKTRKKKDPDLDPATIKVRLPNETIQTLVKAQIGAPACMNKGFILDGYPRNINDAKAIFLDAIPGYEAPEGEEAEEVKGQPEENNEDGTFPGFTISEKILPQYTVIFEADNEALKQKMKDLPPEQIQGTNKDDANLSRRLGVYRELNGSIEAETHIHNFFTKLIGDENCMLLDNPEETMNQDKTLNLMRGKLE